MIHAFVVFCQIANPGVCMDIPIQQSTYEPPTSIAGCLIGGAIYAAEHGEITDINGNVWKAKSAVRCEAETDPVKAEAEIQQWIADQRARRRFNLPQTR